MDVAFLNKLKTTTQRRNRLTKCLSHPEINPHRHSQHNDGPAMPTFSGVTLTLRFALVLQSFVLSYLSVQS